MPLSQCVLTDAPCVCCVGREYAHTHGADERRCPQDTASAHEVLGVVVEKCGAQAITCVDQSPLRWTPIHLAIYRGDRDLANKLFETLCSLSTSTEHSRLLTSAEEEVQRFRDEQQTVPLECFRSVPQSARVSRVDGTVEFRGFITLRSSYGCPGDAKVYYEITLVRLDAEPQLQLGFASAAFKRESCLRALKVATGVGDDADSWAVDGVRQFKWHKGTKGSSKGSYKARWEEGDVIGLCADLRLGQMLISVNGSFAAPNGLIFESGFPLYASSVPEADGEGGAAKEEGRERDEAGGAGVLFAAFSGVSGGVRYNLGHEPFAFKEPGGYVPFASFAPSSP